MDGLFNMVSNYANMDHVDNTGNSIMAIGDTTMLAVGPYKCSEGTCAQSSNNNNPTMLMTFNLNGKVKCVEDNASCVLDGENTRRVMTVSGTGSGTLTLRALTFDKGDCDVGGGVVIRHSAIVDLALCIFSNNRATTGLGGGAIFVHSSGTPVRVNIIGTSFNENTAESGNGDDICSTSSTTITIHNTCPSPYSSITPIQGKTRMRIV
jgi:predicted outer membrane repeat protein